MDIEQHLGAVRAALTPDATPEQRAIGATTCRAILAYLEPRAPEPPPAASSAPVAPNTQSFSKLSPQAQAAVGAILAMRGKPTEQIFELAIAGLRSLLPAGATVPAVAGALRMPPMVEIPAGAKP